MIMVDHLGFDNLYLAPIPPLERHGGGKGRHLGAELELGAVGGGLFVLSFAVIGAHESS